MGNVATRETRCFPLFWGEIDYLWDMCASISVIYLDGAIQSTFIRE